MGHRAIIVPKTFVTFCEPQEKMRCFSVKGPENERKTHDFNRNNTFPSIIYGTKLAGKPSVSHTRCISTYSSQKQYSFVSIMTPHSHSYYHTAINRRM